MADVKISALPASTTPLAGTEVLPIVQSSTTRQVSVANLTAGRAVSALSIATTTGATFATTSGSVGIGTSSPSYTLDVLNSASATLTTRIKNSNASGLSGILFDNNSSTAGASVAFNSSTNLFEFWTNSDNGFRWGYAGSSSSFTERMRITNAGNVGIGTSSPNAKLQVTSSAFPVLKVADAVGGGALALGDEGTNNNYVGVWRGAANSISGGGFLNVQGNGIAFMSSDNVFGSASERMRIDSSGNLLVGVTNTAHTSAGFTVEAGGVPYTTRASGGTLMGFYDTSAAIIGSITNSGGVAVLYNTTSDQRLKTNIVDAQSGNIDNIKVRSFNWLSNNSHQEYGMVAQELLEVAPYAVYQPENPDEMMAVDYSKLVPMMIKEIQDLKQRIATLENK